MPIAVPKQLTDAQQAEEAQLVALSAKLRTQPWYIEQLRQWGANPNDPNLKLSKSQAVQLNALAKQHGFDMGKVGVINQQGSVESVNHTSTLANIAKAALVIGGVATGGTLLAGALAAGAGGGAAAAGGGGAAAADVGATTGLDSAGLASLGSAGAWTPGLGTAGAAGAAGPAMVGTVDAVDSLGNPAGALATNSAPAAAGAAPAAGGSAADLYATSGPAAKIGMQPTSSSFVPSSFWSSPGFDKTVQIGTQLIGGKIGADAANNAAQLQYQSTQNALAQAKAMWDQQQQNMAPWLQYGTGALQTLGGLMGISPVAPGGALGGGPGTPQNGGAPPPPGFTGSFTGNAPPPGTPGTYQPGSPNDPNMQHTLGAMYGNGTVARQAMPPTGGTPPPPGPGGQPVTMQPPAQGPSITRITWPNGQTAEVPVGQLQKYLQLGAEQA